jgi:hypothetical protein
VPTGPRVTGSGAVRTARTLGGIHGTTTGDWAIASGWIARSLMRDALDSSERGWIALTEAMFDKNRRTNELALGRAVQLGREMGPERRIQDWRPVA